jgi:hypothetical protein
VKLVDLKNVDQFFTDPKTQAAPQPRPDPKLMQIQTQAQLDAQQAQGQLSMQDRKAEHEAALAQQRFELDRQMALLQHELAMRDQQFRHVQAALGAAGGGQGAPDGNAGAAAPGAAGLVAQLMDTIRQMNAPKRVVRDAQGRVSHVEPIPMSMPISAIPPVAPTPPPIGTADHDPFAQ